MESIISLSIIIKIASICLQICTFVGIIMLMIITCCKKESTEEYEDRNLKPKVSREIMKSPAQRRAIAKIRQGQMTPANENETVDDAISNWGAVQKVEDASKILQKELKMTNDLVIVLLPFSTYFYMFHFLA